MIRCLLQPDVSSIHTADEKVRPNREYFIYRLLFKSIQKRDQAAFSKSKDDPGGSREPDFRVSGKLSKIWFSEPRLPKDHH